MVLVLTLHRLSAINCTACTSILALTSLAADDDVSNLLELLQGWSLPTLHNIRSFKFFMIPMSTVCTRDVVLGDRNSNWIFFKECKWGCAAQLSRTGKVFFDFHCNSTFQLISHSLKISDVVHAFLLAYYRTGKLSILIPLQLSPFPSNQQLPFISSWHVWTAQHTYTIHCFLWTR
jgi:hypothetical protein